MLAALACLRYQIELHIVCYGSTAAEEGNMRLHRWLGVDIRFTGDPGRSSVDAGIEASRPSFAPRWNSGRRAQIAAAEAALIGAVRGLLEQGQRD